MSPGRYRIRRGVVRACLAVLALNLSGCASAPGEYEARFEHGAVAADQAIASEAGAEMLRKGGNAVDAAVATSFTLSVVRPESCGIGGGGFMVIHLAAGAATRAGPTKEPIDVALNYREMAPAAVGPDYYEHLTDKHASTHGAKAVGIPGTVAGLLYALDHYGTLSRETVIAPAIRAAESGFRADKHYVAEAHDAARKFEENPEFKTRFAFVWDRYLKRGRVEVGDRIRVPAQAAALRLIAEQGAAAFYEGPIADAIVETAQRDGGPLTREDLKSFKVAQVEPLRFTFMDRTFLTMPPPSSGGVAMAEALGIFGRIMPSLDLGQPEPARPGEGTEGAQARRQQEGAFKIELARRGNLYTHALAESFKHAFADRSRWLGDPAFVDVPTTRLMSAEYQRDRASTFKPFKTLKPAEYGTTEDPPTGRSLPEDHGTSHFCTADRWGDAVACTETINLGFGSCMAVERYGFILNDQMDDFTTRLGKANAYGLKQSDRNLPAPGKRPLSSMTPTIVLDQQGSVRIIAGASGGPRIISATTQAILNILLFRADAGQAVAWPRLHHQWSPDVLRMESPLMDEPLLPVVCGGPGSRGPTPAELIEVCGHKVERIDSVAHVQVIARDGRGWDAACDPRKGGRPAGH